ESVTEWGEPPGTEAHDTVVLVVAELAANAVRHGRVPGGASPRRFPATRVWASSESRWPTFTPRGWRDRLPIRTRADATDCLVDALAADWGVRDSPGPARRSGGVHDGAPFHRPRRGQIGRAHV